MALQLFFFSLIVAAIFALLEIQIEGENGWASKLPTWKLNNPFRTILNWPYLTGYHFYFNFLLLALLQLPFFVGFSFNLLNEVLIFEIYLLILLQEDFFWFVLNPKWGVKRFFTDEIPWHSKKILCSPRNYWIGFVIVVVLETAGKFLHTRF